MNSNNLIRGSSVSSCWPCFPLFHRWYLKVIIIFIDALKDPHSYPGSCPFVSYVTPLFLYKKRCSVCVLCVQVATYASLHLIALTNGETNWWFNGFNTLSLPRRSFSANIKHTTKLHVIRWCIDCVVQPLCFASAAPAGIVFPLVLFVVLAEGSSVIFTIFRFCRFCWWRQQSDLAARFSESTGVKSFYYSHWALTNIAK